MKTLIITQEIINSEISKIVDRNKNNSCCNSNTNLTCGELRIIRFLNTVKPGRKIHFSF